VRFTVRNGGRARAAGRCRDLPRAAGDARVTSRLLLLLLRRRRRGSTSAGSWPNVPAGSPSSTSSAGSGTRS